MNYEITSNSKRCKYEKLSKRKDNLASDDTIIISVGMPIERKGILEFIALAELMPEYRFIWIGDISKVILPKSIKKELQDTAEIPNIYFTGYLAHESLRKLYNIADMFALLSFEETEGLVVLEALACKQKVLLNDIPVFKGWLDNECYKTKIEKKEKRYEAQWKEQIERTSQIIRKAITDSDDKIVTEGYWKAQEKNLKEIGLLLHNEYEELYNSHIRDKISK